MADDLRDLFATNLRRLRHARGLSQDELADEAEVSRSYLAQVETAKKHISLKIISKLAQALDVDPVEFFRRPARRDRAKQ
jgi:transcriptional regulator with XRE-family HTH domain